MVQEDIGQATIVYEGPDGDAVERTVDNEHVAYFQDHWIVKIDDETQEEEVERMEGRDTVRRIPANRVYYVERSVEEFEEEVKTLRDQFQSITEDLRSKLMGGGQDQSDTEPHRIEVERGDRDDET
ncbi:hypothetical protein G9464_09500 [Halostella sp. JP-L12]|uniref:hypothetical protein n=1 Tax=Halostella TaxID=1843185 RepID=UPI000EF82AA8|nr:MULTISPECIES: hypothetical protein [Halostella]NHN47830.1 hypothetical protein [Halostella sp. JP-L12]